jgi:hypothetical protein
MFNYITKHGVQGMLSSRYKSLENWQGYIKNFKEVILFNSSLINNYKNFKKINLNYINSKEIEIEGYSKKSFYKSFQIVSFFNKEFFKLKGKDHKEIRECRNKYNKIVIIKSDLNDINEIKNFILEWNKKRGEARYGWHLHSGYDINFFERYWEEEKNNLWSNFFYIKNKLVGYSICSKDKENNCYNYIIRKGDTSYRNLNLYIDYKTFEKINENNENFYINWGCSSGSLLKYKKKFPIYKLEDKWFLKFIKI